MMYVKKNYFMDAADGINPTICIQMQEESTKSPIEYISLFMAVT